MTAQSNQQQMWLEVTPHDSKPPRRLLVFLHGAGSRPETFAPLAIAWQYKFPGAIAIVMQGLVDRESPWIGKINGRNVYIGGSSYRQPIPEKFVLQAAKQTNFFDGDPFVVWLSHHDIEVAGLTQSHIKAMADEAGNVRVKCKACESGQVIDDKLLGTEVQCESCEEPFLADWGEPVMELPKPEKETTRAKVDFARREVCFEDGSREELSEREADLLRYLVSQSGRAVPRDELLRQVWGIDPKNIETRTVDMHVAHLRQKLRNADALVTVRGKGYMLGT